MDGNGGSSAAVEDGNGGDDGAPGTDFHGVAFSSSSIGRRCGGHADAGGAGVASAAKSCDGFGGCCRSGPGVFGNAPVLCVHSCALPGVRMPALAPRGPLVTATSPAAAATASSLSSLSSSSGLEFSLAAAPSAAPPLLSWRARLDGAESDVEDVEVGVAFAVDDNADDADDEVEDEDEVRGVGPWFRSERLRRSAVTLGPAAAPFNCTNAGVDV